jgi:hypothetical protein
VENPFIDVHGISAHRRLAKNTFKLQFLVDFFSCPTKTQCLTLGLIRAGQRIAVPAN